MSRFLPQSLHTIKNSSLILRSVEPSDYESYVHFQKQVASETQFTLQIPGLIPDQDILKLRWQKALQHDAVESTLGCFEGAHMIALLGIHPERDNHPWIRHVASFFMMILQSHWGQGLGKAMLCELIEHAKTLNIRRLEARVRCNNERGIALYKSMGFEFEGTRRHAALINGHMQDEYYIAKILA